MEKVASNQNELVTLYAEQVGVVATRAKAGENSQCELEEIIQKAADDFGLRSGAS